MKNLLNDIRQIQEQASLKQEDGPTLVTVPGFGRVRADQVVKEINTVGQQIQHHTAKGEWAHVKHLHDHIRQWIHAAHINKLKMSISENIETYDSMSKWEKDAKERGYDVTHGSTGSYAFKRTEKEPVAVGKFRNTSPVPYGHLVSIQEEKEKDWGDGGDDPINEEYENKDKKFKVSYDIHGSNREVPLYSSHKHVYAKDENEAITTIKSLIGGRNHKAELAEAVETKLQMSMPLFIRLLEWAKEECKSDVEIHQLAEKIAAVNGVADMDSYEALLEYYEIKTKNPHKKGTLKHNMWERSRKDYLDGYSKDPYGSLKSGDKIAGPSGLSTIKEAILAEMGDTQRGKSVLASYIKKRSVDVANDAAADGLEAGVNLKHSSRTVYGLDPETKEPIYSKPKPKFKESKKLAGIHRAVERLVK